MPEPARLDHLGIAVQSLDEALKFYEDQLGLRVTLREMVAVEKVNVAMLPLGAADVSTLDPRIELLEAAQPDSVIGKFIERHGEGLHHVALRVPDLAATIERLRFSGARAGTLTNRFCGVANGNFCVAPSGAVSACHEVADERQPFAARFFYARPSAAGPAYDFDEPVYSALRAQTVDHLDRCRDCFAKWNCAGDCYHKSLHAGPTRCEIIRELTKDQLLENIASSGGIFWKHPARPAATPSEAPPPSGATTA